MQLSVKQAAEKAGKNVETIRRWIKTGKLEAKKVGRTWQISQASLESYIANQAGNQTKESIITEKTIAQIASKVAAELKPMLELAKQNQTEQIKKTEMLCKENDELKNKIVWLETEMQAIKNFVKELVQNNQTKPLEKNKQEQAKPAEPKPSQPEPSKTENAKPIDEEKAEKWLKENLHEWLDQFCPFKQANNRTWRQLGENKGEKITMNGKGPQQPRAYLHALESWQNCKPWARLKAKVALEICKNGTGCQK